MNRDEIYDWCDALVAADRIREKILRDRKPCVRVHIDSRITLVDIAYVAGEAVHHTENGSCVHIRGVEFFCWDKTIEDEDDD